MNFLSWLIDRKIGGINVTVEMSIGEYWSIAESILEKNEYQRKRVSSSGKVYELLRRDLLGGCVIPPIILAATENHSLKIEEQISSIIQNQEIRPETRNVISAHVERAAADSELLILDGLQRTFTIRQCIQDATEAKILDQFLAQKIRTEIYVGISKMGILYRMLTLNTGQTPMSFRHQIEILYSDYLNKDDLPDGIRVVKELEGGRARGTTSYKYSDVVDLFYAYSTGTPRSVDRQTLVDNLRELDFLEGFKPDTDDMQTLLIIYNSFVSAVDSKAEDWQYPNGMPDDHEVERPFGRNVGSILGRVQPMTGFGAECKRLINLGQYASIEEFAEPISMLGFGDGRPHEVIAQLIMILDDIAASAKKIGDAQRNYFQFCFRQLLNKESDAYLDLSRCWAAGQETYNSMF